jgi:phosphate transport system ATP-binding protein
MVKEKISIRKLDIKFGEVRALNNVSIDIFNNEILSIIGPSNSGKTTFLRSLNRLNDLEDRIKSTGSIHLDGKNIYSEISAEDLRKRVGMIFALPIPLPISIYENVSYGPRMAGLKDKKELDRIVERSLWESFLWDEVKDRLGSSALKLSGGQQQRLCISRALALDPDVLLFDEPCSGLDPISTAKVEESMMELKKTKTIVLVTNNTKQAARVGTRTAFFLMGELIEIDTTDMIFTAPKDKRTNDYITGRFG